MNCQRKVKKWVLSFITLTLTLMLGLGMVGFFRELLGSGELLGYKVIPQFMYDAGYQNNGLMMLAPMALILVAVIIWVHRSRNKELQEETN